MSNSKSYDDAMDSEGALKGVANVDPVSNNGVKRSTSPDGQEMLSKMVDNFRDFLVEKNRRYENSASEPVGVFTRFIRDDDDLGRATILVRLDDKLKRIITSGKSGDELRKNDVVDLVGYLMLLMREDGWDSFEDLLD